MGKRWTWDDDLFLASYYDTLGDFVGYHDLGRPVGAADKRVLKLKACGAWAYLKAFIADDYRNKRGYLISLGQRRDVEVMDDMHLGAPDAA